MAVSYIREYKGLMASYRYPLVLRSPNSRINNFNQRLIYEGYRFKESYAGENKPSIAERKDFLLQEKLDDVIGLNSGREFLRLFLKPDSSTEPPSSERVNNDLSTSLATKALFVFAHEFVDRKWVGYYFARATVLDPENALKHSDKYKDKTWAFNLLRESLKYNIEIALYAFKYFHKYRDESWAGDLLNIAAGKNPEAAIEFYDVYKDRPVAADIVYIGFELARKTGLENIDKFEVDFPWVKEYEGLE